MLINPDRARSIPVHALMAEAEDAAFLDVDSGTGFGPDGENVGALPVILGLDDGHVAALRN